MPEDVVLSFEWAGIDDGDRHRATAVTADDVTDVLGLIHSTGVRRGQAQLVDVRVHRLHPDLSPPEAIVQVMLGDPYRGAVLWHEKKVSSIAIQPVLLPGDPISCAHDGRLTELPPAWTRITPTDVLRILTTYLTEGQLPSWVIWWPAPDLRPLGTPAGRDVRPAGVPVQRSVRRSGFAR
jgi:hypothetical protein